MQRGHGDADRLLVEGFDGVDGMDLDLIDRVVASGGEGEDATRMVMVNNFLGPKRFGKMFPDLQPFRPPDQALIDLGRAMRETAPEDPALENTQIPAGFTYLGQFVDHDLTRDETRNFPVIDDPELIRQGRTPTLDLDSLYGEGPRRQPDLYDNLPPSETRFRFGTTVPTPIVNVALPNDLPRRRDGHAVIGDDRNDENLVVAQTHLAFLKFHNRVMDLLPRGDEDDGSATFTQAEETRKSTSFHNARRAVRWHYQWLVLNDFLRRILDPGVLDDVRTNGRRFFRFDRAPFGGEPFMPLEFSGAAYRFGHSMVRETYNYNRVFTDASLALLFTFTGGGGGAPIPSDWVIDWRRFHEVGQAGNRNFTRNMDLKLIPQLHELPNVRPNQPRSLAVRNLLRGSRVGLPKAQDVAEAMDIEPLTREQLGGGEVGPIARRHGPHRNTPLWYYILKKAQAQTGGGRLGEMGSRIVAETFWGLLEGDENSFVSRSPGWTPAEDGLPARVPGDFTTADLLRIVGEINPIGS